MRRIFVLALVLGATRLIQPLGSPGLGSQTLLAFGIMILGAYAAGELLVGFGLPKLVGYIVAGVAFGPSALRAVPAASVTALAPVSSLAIALIAFLAGAELRWSEVRRMGTAIARILGAELGVTFVAVTALLIVARRFVPFLAGGTTTEVIAFSLLFASVAVVHSPAVTMALLTETRSDGPLSRTSLGVVLFSDVVIVLLLTGTLALVRAVVPPGGANLPTQSVAMVGWEVVGAVIIGALLGGAVALYLHFVRRELFLFAILVAFFGAELARLVHVEPLLLLIAAGFVTENVSAPDDGAALRGAMERAAAPVFVVFFAIAGANIDLAGLRALWPMVIPLVVVRSAGLWSGCRVGLRWARLAESDSRGLKKGLWTALVSQAGVAIGLVAVVAQVYPSRGGEMRDLFLAMLAVNQLLGAVLFRRALARAGEVGAAGRDGAPVAHGAAPAPASSS
jgi:Kef-type K+ transport system membrane component KefB